MMSPLFVLEALGVWCADWSVAWRAWRRWLDPDASHPGLRDGRAGSERGRHQPGHRWLECRGRGPRTSATRAVVAQDWHRFRRERTPGRARWLLAESPAARGAGATLFALLMLGAAWSLLRRRAAADQGNFTEDYTAAAWLRLAVLGLAVGLLTGFFGVGGGFLIVPALVVVLGLPMRLAVGTSLLAIALNALWGLLGYLRFGDLDWSLTGLVRGRRFARSRAGWQARRTPARACPAHCLRQCHRDHRLLHVRPQRTDAGGHGLSSLSVTGGPTMQIRTLRTPGLGDATYMLSHGGLAIVVDPQRDIDRFLEAAAADDAEIRFVLETHVHNDYVSGGRALAGEVGAHLLLPAGAGVAFEHVPPSTTRK